MVSKERRLELLFQWFEDECWPPEWRIAVLNEEERALLLQWEKQYNSSVYRLFLDILQAEQYSLQGNAKRE